MDNNTPRKLDTAVPASIDHVSLNNQIVGMRKTVKRTKVQLINRMVKRVRQLKNSRGSEMAVAKKQRKAERTLQEIQVVKNLDPDKVTKYALANTSTVKDVANLPPTSETKAMARYANHKIMQEAISKFREKHSDWKALAAYMLTKNTGRRFKKKVTKEKVTAESAATNKKAGESLMKTFLEQKIGESNEMAVNEPEGLLKEKNKQRSKNINTSNMSNSPGELNNGKIENLLEHSNSSEPESDEDSEIVTHVSNVKHPVQSRAEMVVAPISLDSDNEDMLKIPDEKSQRTRQREHITHDANNPDEDRIPNFLQLPNQKSKTLKMKKDAFFMCSDDEMDSGNESNNEKLLKNDDDGDDDDDNDDVEDNVVQIQKGKMAMRSTFLGSLTDNKKEKIWAGKHSAGRHMRESRNSTEKRGWTSHRDHPYKPFKPGVKQTKQRSVNWNQNTNNQSSLPSKNSTSLWSSESKKQESEEKAEKLHPSWQASKLRKQQASQIQAFQGKKTTFSDDD